MVMIVNTECTGCVKVAKLDVCIYLIILGYDPPIKMEG